MAWLATLRRRLPGHCTDRGNSALAPTQSAPTSASAGAGFFGDPLHAVVQVSRYAAGVVPVADSIRPTPF